MNTSLYTKNLFADALMELMRTRDLKDIRVTELCQRADAGRKTFYNHFEDKYDLAAWIISERLGAFADRTEAITLVYQQMKENRAFYRHLYLDPGISEMINYLVHYFNACYQDLLTRRQYPLTDAERFSLRLYVYGSIYMTREWILDDCRLPAQELSERMQENQPAWLREALIREESAEV